MRKIDKFIHTDGCCYSIIGVLTHIMWCMQLYNAAKVWKLVSITKVYSGYYINLYEDILNMGGREKTYIEE